jgi:hypothetical protein
MHPASWPAGPTLEDSIGNVPAFFILIAGVVLVLIAAALLVDHGPRLFYALTDRVADYIVNREESRSRRNAAASAARVRGSQSSLVRLGPVDSAERVNMNVTDSSVSSYRSR